MHGSFETYKVSDLPQIPGIVFHVIDSPNIVQSDNSIRSAIQLLEAFRYDPFTSFG